MSEQSANPSLLRPFAIFSAISLGFYLLLVWDPIGTYGDVRGYFEYRVRAPLEWIMVFFAVSFVMQRSSVMRAMAAVLLPIFILILTITRPDHGASFWRIFGQEMYVTPMYVPRGFLIYFFLLCFVLVSSQKQWKVGQQSPLLLGIIITFVVTSWGALIAESPARSYATAGGSWGSMEGWRATAQGGWGIITQTIDQEVSPKWRDEAKIAVALYPFFAFVALLFPGYRMLPKDFVSANREMFPFYAVVLGLLGLSAWALWEVDKRGLSVPASGSTLLLGLLGIPALLAALFLAITSVLWVPMGLFLLPAFVFSVVSLPFKLGYFLVIYGPIMAWQHLHYMFVPHPAERVYREGLQNDIPLHTIAGNVADILYQQDFEALRRKRHPPAWVSKNQEKRVRALCEELHAGNEFMEELKRNIRLRDELQL